MNRNPWVKTVVFICASVLWFDGAHAAADETTVTIAEARSAENSSDDISRKTAEALQDNPLAGTMWRLVEFQSMDDAIGTLRPDDPSLYTMQLKKDGTVTMRLNCNRASGSWSAEPAGSGESGHFKFGPLAVTRALCPPPSMDERITADAGSIRSYLLKDGRLYLSLMADAGIYAWEPDADPVFSSGVPAGPEDGGPSSWEVTGVSSALNLRKQPSTTAEIVTRLEPGTILDNLGCQQTDGEVWCRVQQPGGGPQGYVSAKFLKPAASSE